MPPQTTAAYLVRTTAASCGGSRPLTTITTSKAPNETKKGG
jgi:hypothetical protein